ncbi:mandelamide hydrolase-like [Patiria miniata]|uniref:Amidase domain-containing protein n=1 Tax=Patiria miniata TaxID=46514 RepID=A0A914B3M7_PATMI|nr:mandelamide hydrolase-like [Patiria miniata]
MYRLGINDLLQQFSDGSLTCEAYTKRVIQRVQDLKVFNYFVSMNTDRMLKDAQEADARYKNKTNRLLEGIPIAMKDNIDIEGEPTEAGTPGLAGLKPKHTAEVARRLFDAGAIHAGRANMHELAFGISSCNAHKGPCHNFHNFDYTCGGSSGGSGGAVSADIVPAALGTDTGGSIRIPSSYNGVFGLRPTSGRWPADYGAKMSHVRDSVGPLVRSAVDIAILDGVMTGEQPHEELKPGQIRIGVPRPQFWEGLDAEVEEYAERFLVRLRETGFGIVEVPEVPGSRELLEKYFMVTINQEVIPRLEEYLSYHGHNVTAQSVIDKIASPDVKGYFRYVQENPPTEEEYKKAMAAREEARKNLKTYFEDHRLDCILVPANKIPPPTLRAFEDRNSELVGLITQNDDFGNICNNPSLVIPGGFARRSGVPFGMQIEGYTGSDRRVIAVAVAIEKALNL